MEHDATLLRDIALGIVFAVAAAHLARLARQPLEYGDLAHPDSLEHLGIERARIIVCTISDTWLKGISARRLLENLKKLAPEAKIVMTGEEKADWDLMKAGAHHVLIPGEITGERIFQLLTEDRM